MGTIQIERVDLDTNIENRKSVLQEYYARYLTKVRGSSESSVKHYLDVLNNISRRLKEKEIVSTDIYEIMDIQALSEAKKFCMQTLSWKSFHILV